MPNNLIRVNTRIPRNLNAWLDREAAETGLTKSTMIHLALENFYNQRVALEGMSKVSEELRQLKELLPTKS